MSFKKKKSLGQHFLNDQVIIYQIINAIKAGEHHRAFEIGAGTGALTKWLAQKFEDLHAIEIDERAVEKLREEMPDLTIHQEDVLKVNWEELVSKEQPNFVIGNLPYYITSPILFGLLEQRELFTEAILMMQKEVAERLVAEPGTKDYGILSVQTQAFSSPEILFDVAPESFSPPPNVTSSVVRITFDKTRLPFKDTSLKKIVRTAFNQRRKKLSNSLKPVLGKYRPEGFDLDDRAEHWAPEVYAKLAEHLEQTDKIA